MIDVECNMVGLYGVEFVIVNCFIRCEVLSFIGGFDECFKCLWWEDFDFYFMFFEVGCWVVFVLKVIVIYLVCLVLFGILIK